VIKFLFSSCKSLNPGHPNSDIFPKGQFTLFKQKMAMKKIIELQNQIILADSLSLLKEIEDNTFDLIITSPPYFQQRDYGNGNLGIGNEKTEAEYLENLLQIFRECVRTVKETGAIVFNLGDKYINGSLSLDTI
jgi:site-specific DNA-methyltransferase (adenine-specific)